MLVHLIKASQMNFHSIIMKLVVCFISPRHRLGDNKIQNLLQNTSYDNMLHNNLGMRKATLPCREISLRIHEYM